MQSSAKKNFEKRRLGKMLNDEIEIMRDAFCFLRDHNDPPANDSGRLMAYWERTAFAMGRLAEKRNGHQLAAVVLAGLCE